MDYARGDVLKLIENTNIQPGMKILDLGCGTGTLTLMIQRAYPDVNITGLDGDVEVLDIARKKSHGVDVQWDEGLASSLPYPDSFFDRVVTSLVIHHLTTADKRRALIFALPTRRLASLAADRESVGPRAKFRSFAETRQFGRRRRITLLFTASTIMR